MSRLFVRSALFVFLSLFAFPSESVFSLSDFYWEAPVPFVTGAARYPVSASGPVLTAVAWQESERIEGDGMRISISLAVKRPRRQLADISKNRRALHFLRQRTRDREHRRRRQGPNTSRSLRFSCFDRRSDFRGFRPDFRQKFARLRGRRIKFFGRRGSPGVRPFRRRVSSLFDARHRPDSVSFLFPLRRRQNLDAVPAFCHGRRSSIEFSSNPLVGGR